MPTTLAKTAKEFNAALDKFVEETVPEELSQLHRKIIFDILGGVVSKTPSDLGHARNNWQVAIGKKITSVVAGVDDSTGGTRTIKLGESRLADLPPFQIVWITNNLPYIEVLENGTFDPPNPGPSKDPRPSRTGRILVSGGFSVQAPKGMVSLTLQEVIASFN